LLSSTAADGVILRSCIMLILALVCLGATAIAGARAEGRGSLSGWWLVPYGLGNLLLFVPSAKLGSLAATSLMLLWAGEWLPNLFIDVIGVAAALGAVVLATLAANAVIRWLETTSIVRRTRGDID